VKAFSLEKELMMKFNILAVFKWIFSRIGFFYLLIVLLAILLIDFNAASSRIKIRRLNDARPEMFALVSFGQGDIAANKLDWKPYLNYFSLVVDYMPGEEVTRMFLGVCEHYTGDIHKRAWPYIQHAAEKYPFIFWSVYNAGVLAFERGDMELATRYLNMALVLPADRASAAIQGSVIYRQIMASPNFNVKVTDEINTARENVYLLMAAASFYTKDYEKAKTLALYPLSKMDVQDKEAFYFYAGAASMGLGQAQESMALMSKCVELKSRNPQVYRYVGQILKASGKVDMAEDVLKTAQALEDRQKDGFPYPERLRLRFF
jgi:tetratricopeptide (TPR) repeat protein